MSQKNFLSSIDPYLKLIRFDRPIGTLLLLWPTLWALWLAADGIPPIKYLVIFALGVFLMRSAGCAINDIADRKFDAKVKRTRNRPLAQQQLPVVNALIMFVVLLLCAVLLLTFLNVLAMQIAMVAAFFAITYPFMKRYTYLPQVYLGIAFALSIPMAYAQIQGKIPAEAWLLFIANIFWTTAYDTMYAMVDRECDEKIGVKSTAILFGDLDILITHIIQGFMMLVLLLLGRKLELNMYYYFGLLASVILFVYQNKLLRSRNTDNYFKAFLNNNWVGMIIFIGIAVATTN
ncbi:MAG TPA: 4-hydroxybenzoate octaprenyltransferase [Gammaproteobacteria bacterium]|nr:4-hydroxybenzoate octaprenyltransferase [Xanthomonadales bacterium]HOP22008.1 4-hydroxybenzoate octaprenyltransferase [Gammaproteobacteria bacterium]HPI94826.1 4-hydroxybenzoate octaprenyltransferase [Gammaproteobacteria bacterium]HPQ86419.1 4-hydroxybenzoate octaprenyltransferase [Gammaproteobacteria bacterium]